MSADIRPLDGVGNNLLHPEWGSTDENLLRRAPAEYTDGIAAPAGTGRPSAREISNAVVDHPEEAVLNDRNLSNFVYAWGQFIDHDFGLTETAVPTESFPASIPLGDPDFDPNGTGTASLRFSRSDHDPDTGTGIGNPRMQTNSVTSYLDGSMVYGSDAERAAALRTFTGGRLAVSEGNLLPFNTSGLENINGSRTTPDDRMFVAGDVRANENVELTAIHTLFVREHNRLADEFARKHPNWSDEQLYQAARRVVIGEIQAITYNEFLPALLGPNALRPSRGYDPRIDPGLVNEFSTAAFRFGHSMLGDDIEFLADDGSEVRDAIALKDAFFNPSIVSETGIEPILKYLTAANAEEIDTLVVDGLRNFLFGQPGQGGFDLPALNIQRGRDHGLADYNTTRAAYGLPRVTSFSEITSDLELQARLEELYGSVDEIDLWVGGLAEDHVRGGSLGPLFTRIIADQFMRMRDGDRFFYQWEFRGRELHEIESTSLTAVIKRNTTLLNIQENSFVFKTGISGRVYDDRDRDGRSDPGEKGIAGRKLELRDEAGVVVAVATTDALGRYRFDHPGLGRFTVAETSPPGGRPTKPATRSVAITRGMEVKGVDFGETVTQTRRNSVRLRTADAVSTIDTVGLSKAESSLDRLTSVVGESDEPLRRRPFRFLR
jgi:hypothetical protein